MNNIPFPNEGFVIHYMKLRKAIGILGITLPFILAFGNMVFEHPGIESSISGYYYTSMRNVFVGMLCSISIFMMSYRGHGKNDNIAGNCACAFGIGVAMFPTAPEFMPTPWQTFIGYIHLSFAALYFMSLTYFSLFLFTQTHIDKEPTPQKLKRNLIYKICGYLMSTSLICMLIFVFLPDVNKETLRPIDPIFWLESTAIVAFGISWITKGEWLFKDVESPETNLT